MSSSTNDHHSNLVDLRNDINSQTQHLLIELGVETAVVVVGVVIMTLFSAGAAAAGPDEAAAGLGTAEASAAIVETATTIRELITGSQLLVLLAGVAGGFAAASGLTPNSVLQHIAMLTAQTIDEGDDRPRYDPSPKHNPGQPSPGRRGTPMDLSDEDAQQVLDDSIPSGKQRYGYKEGKVYVFQPDGAGGYHGYPQEATQDTPPDVLRKMKERGDISNAEYNKLRKGK